MEFLEADEASLLRAILVNHALIANEDARSDLLVNCGLQALVPALSSLGKSPLLFVNELSARLSRVYTTSQPLEQPGLVALLNYITMSPYDDELIPEEKRFLERVKQKCLQWYTAQTQKQEFSFSQLSAQENRLLDTPVHTKANITREELVVSYGLYTLVSEFTSRVNYGRVVGFTVCGDFTILRDYIIERMRMELRRKVPGEQKLLDINLTADDLALGTGIIAQKLTHKYGCKQLTDLFKIYTNAHHILVAWCYGVPLKHMKGIVSSFREELDKSVAPLLHQQRRCLVLLLANVEREAASFQLDGFKHLLVPSEYDTADLQPWFQGRLEDLGITQSDIEYCMRRLADQHGHFIRTYRELESMVTFLQEKYAIRSGHQPGTFHKFR
jgi:hypothetical protein